MSQVYERLYGRLTGNALTIAVNGHAYLLQVPFFNVGFLTKVLAQQASGTPVAFTVDVLNSTLSLTPGEIDPATLPAGWQMRRVMTPLAGTSGNQAAAFIPNGNSFRNQDGPDPVRSGVSVAPLSAGQTAYTNSQRYLYVLLQPASGAGVNSTWEVCLGAWNEVK